MSGSLEVEPAKDGGRLSVRARRISRRGFLLAAAAGGLALTGCEEWQHQLIALARPANRTPVPAATPSPTSTPRGGGQLRMGIPVGPTSLDPALAPGDPYLQGCIYDALLSMDRQLHPLPGLAETWELPDERTVVLYLRRGVRFHDGTELDAEAVKLSLDRARDPATKSPHAADLEPVEAVQVVDRLTARLKLKWQAPAMIAALAGPACQVYSPSAFQQQGQQFGRHPVGTGPYSLREWVDRDRVVLGRNPDHWNGEAALLEEIVFRIVPDGEARLAGLKAGELDLVADVALKEVPTLRGRSDLQMLRSWKGVEGLILNVGKAPFNKKPLRQALQIALDRAAIHRNLHLESGMIGYGPVHPPGSWGFDPDWKPLQRDLDQVRAKLREGGAAGSFGFRIMLSDSADLPLAEAYLAMLAPLGIKATLDRVDEAKRVANLESGGYEAALAFWPTRPDPGPGLQAAYHSRGSANRVRYSNPKVDELLDKGERSYDRGQRRGFYREVEQLLVEDAPCLVVYHRPRYDVATAKPRGVIARPDGRLELRGVWLDG